ncbi:MAG: TonB-dependent receptor plug domain-containing protein, partial [Bacteroidota bacterium]
MMQIPCTSVQALQRLLLGFALCLVTTGLFAQNTVSGTVTAADGGDPLAGAAVIVKGTQRGTLTLDDGTFSIAASSGDVLRITYTGYSAQEIEVGNQSNITVALESDLTLSEVVVTGYSVDTRRNTPGSVSTIKAEALKIAPTGNVEQMLQGRVPGVTVVTNGQPGTTSQVRVRGYGALGGNAPLYVVDGVPVQNIDFLNPDDIETTTVLKDATAASIYGARAAGGVIVYTTRKGKRGDRQL